jgi:hypothetical protein
MKTKNETGATSTLSGRPDYRPLDEEEGSIAINGVTFTKGMLHIFTNLIGEDERRLTDPMPEDNTLKMYIETIVDASFLITGIMTEGPLPEEKQMMEMQSILNAMRYDLMRLQKENLKWIYTNKNNTLQP